MKKWAGTARGCAARRAAPAVEAASSYCTPLAGEWAEIIPDRDAKLGTPPATGLGPQSVLVALWRCTMEVRYKGYMNHRHGLIRQSVLGLQTLSNIVFAMALIMSQPSWAATSPVTIGGPFTLIAPDGTTVTDQTYRGKWLLVYS